MNPAIDTLFRRAALEWLDKAKRIHPRGEILVGAQGRNTKFSVYVPQLGDVLTQAFTPTGQGIWKPKDLDAALSLVSSSANVYEDRFDDDVGIVNYKYFDGAYDNRYNRSLRSALEHKLPMLYFRGIREGLYIVEVVVAMEEAPGRDGVLLNVLPDYELSPLKDVRPEDNESFLKVVRDIFEGAKIGAVRYETRMAQQRLYQAEFRQRIMHVYKVHCAVCRFREEPLLEAAHIIPVSKDGPSEVPNGLSLCQIHHGAYDQNILGIDANFRIHINQDMLRRKDGPMLKHGFQGRNAEKILVPKDIDNQPDQDRLAERFAEFSETI